MRSDVFRPVILLIDDDVASTEAIARAVSAREPEAEIHCAHNQADALKFTQELDPVIVLLDLSLDPEVGPDSGLALLPELREVNSLARIYVITGHSDEEWGLRSIHGGASSFIAKPVEISHLLALIKDGISYARFALKRNEAVFTPAASYPSLELHSRSPLMQRALERAAFAASTDQSVLILGETGTGKGVLAQRIARAHRQGNRRFVRFQPSFGSFDLISSELFGHERGAFTGAVDARRGLLEDAHGGTLFIDEIDELPHQTQVSLLHTLQERTFRRLGSNREIRSDFRLIAATNHPLQTLLSEGKLRSDFYHRIAHLVIELPALRNRREDLEDLLRTFLNSPRSLTRPRHELISEEGWQALCEYSWPGNVREFQGVVSSARALARYRKRGRIEVSDLEFSRTLGAEQSRISDLSLRERVRAFEAELAQQALTKANNNQSVAANLLGLDRTSLRRILTRPSVDGRQRHKARS